MKVDTNPQKIDEFLDRAVEDIIVRDDLRREMLSGRQLRVYLGTDPTGGDLHLGHAVIHRKLRDFQDLGHKVILLIGDYTVLVGDHSDKNEQRIELTRTDIESNIKTYKDQFARTVDISKVDIVHNSEWLSKLSFNDVINLAKIFTLQQMSERDAFQKRVKEGKAVGFDELLYPLMQGYDAYALRTDVQIGGSEQLFNLQAGRKIMDAFGVKPQNIIMCKLLTGNDGRKMGKSLHNYIAVNSTAKEKYFGIMGIVDDVIIDYFTLLTRVPMKEIREMEKSLREGAVNPMELKMKLAYDVTRFFHGEREAGMAEESFKREVRQKEVPIDVTEVSIPSITAGSTTTIIELLRLTGLSHSNQDARRLVKEGAVQIDGEVIKDTNYTLELTPNMLISAGRKRGYIRLVK